MRFRALNERRWCVGRGGRLYACSMNIPWDYVIPILSAVISPIVSIFTVRYSNKRRDRERLEQVRREDYASQRRSVSECVRKMRQAETERRDGPQLLENYSQLHDRYKDYLENLDLEVTHPEVRKCLEEWQKKNDEAASELLDLRSDLGGTGSPGQKTIDVINGCPEDLQRSAKEHLHISYDYDQLD